MNSKIKYIIGLIMFLIYLGMGILIIFTKYFMQSVDSIYRIIFGIVLILYGMFRLYKTFRKNKLELAEDEKDNI